MSKIAITEAFGPTMQGEGLMTGTITNFLRTGGCPLRCTWCDSMHSVDPLLIKEHGTRMEMSEIMTLLSAMPWAPYLTLTGGDPCMHKQLGEVIPFMNGMNTRVAVETQGTLFPDWLHRCDVVTFSPKGPSSNNVVDPLPILDWINANSVSSSRKRMFQVCIKIVIGCAEDLDYAIDFFNKTDYSLYDQFWFNSCTPNPGFEIEHTTDARLFGLHMEMRKLVSETLMRVEDKSFVPNDKFRMGFQEHLFVWPTETMGV